MPKKEALDKKPAAKKKATKKSSVKKKTTTKLKKRAAKEKASPPAATAKGIINVHKKKAPKQCDMSFIGKIKFSPQKGVASSPSKPIDRTSHLFACEVALPLGAVVFRIEPVDPTNKCVQAEKTLSEHIREGSNECVKQLNFELHTQGWCINGVEQKNARGCTCRPFVIPVMAFPTVPQIFQMAKVICTNINADPEMEPGNELTFDKKTLFWLGREPVLWQNIMSTPAILKRLKRFCGNMNEGFCDRHRDCVRACFAPGTVDRNLARVLCAPNEMIGPDTQVILPDSSDEDNDDDDEEDEDDEEGDEDEDEDDADSEDDDGEEESEEEEDDDDEAKEEETHENDDSQDEELDVDDDDSDDSDGAMDD